MFYIRRDTKAERKSSSSAPVAAVSPVSFINHCPGFGETIYMRCYSARRCPTNTFDVRDPLQPSSLPLLNQTHCLLVLSEDHTGSQIPPMPPYSVTWPRCWKSHSADLRVLCDVDLWKQLFCCPLALLHSSDECLHNQQAGPTCTRRDAHIFEIVPKTKCTNCIFIIDGHSWKYEHSGHHRVHCSEPCAVRISLCLPSSLTLFYTPWV